MEKELAHLAAKADPRIEREAKARAKRLCKEQKRGKPALR
jgi:hypothetical protein